MATPKIYVAQNALLSPNGSHNVAVSFYCRGMLPTQILSRLKLLNWVSNIRLSCRDNNVVWYNCLYTHNTNNNPTQQAWSTNEWRKVHNEEHHYFHAYERNGGVNHTFLILTFYGGQLSFSRPGPLNSRGQSDTQWDRRLNKPQSWSRK
jgi:hypothetical protein